MYKIAPGAFSGFVVPRNSAGRTVICLTALQHASLRPRIYSLLDPGSVKAIPFKAEHYTNALIQYPSKNLEVQSLRVMSLEQSRQHSGHSHGAGHHHHHHDNTYLTSANKKDAGVRITRIGLYVNLVMAIGKGFGGWLFHSHALVADAGHALTDLVSDFMTLGTVAWALKPPTSRFPSGYGKIESLGSLGVSSLLLTGGILMGLNACDVLCHEFFDFHFLPRVAAHTHSHMPPNINAAWLAAGSIVVKEWLYRASMSSCPFAIHPLTYYPRSYESR